MTNITYFMTSLTWYCLSPPLAPYAASPYHHPAFLLPCSLDKKNKELSSQPVTTQGLILLLSSAMANKYLY